MDEQKKQKILLGVLAALALGAGSYYFLLRDSESSKTQRGRGTVTVKKKRANPGKTVPKRKKRTRQARLRNVPTVERKQHQIRKKQDSTRRTRRGKVKQVKKKKTVPAA